ncbi:hypothetical protein BIFDEN_02092 [Bifidobacterium dentium ATCC 27678]|nr:hypothetical protein BIFDEN_02092 [Bifidobacterium dentium ATCC 27678]
MMASPSVWPDSSVITPWHISSKMWQGFSSINIGELAPYLCYDGIRQMF